jgi:hypothetical protein
MISCQTQVGAYASVDMCHGADDYAHIAVHLCVADEMKAPFTQIMAQLSQEEKNAAANATVKNISNKQSSSPSLQSPGLIDVDEKLGLCSKSGMQQFFHGSARQRRRLSPSTSPSCLNINRVLISDSDDDAHVVNVKDHSAADDEDGTVVTVTATAATSGDDQENVTPGDAIEVDNGDARTIAPKPHLSSKEKQQLARAVKAKLTVPTATSAESTSTSTNAISTKFIKTGRPNRAAASM